MIGVFCKYKIQLNRKEMNYDENVNNRGGFTIGDLKKLIDGLDDNTPG